MSGGSCVDLNENTKIIDREQDLHCLLFLEAVYVITKQPTINAKVNDFQILPSSKCHSSVLESLVARDQCQCHSLVDCHILHLIRREVLIIVHTHWPDLLPAGPHCLLEVCKGFVGDGEAVRDGKALLVLLEVEGGVILHFLGQMLQGSAGVVHLEGPGWLMEIVLESRNLTCTSPSSH